MKPLMLIVAACAALLFTSPAEAKLFHRHARVEVAIAVTAAPAPAAPVVETLAVEEPKTRRLTLRERLQARWAASKAIRAVRVSTLEAVN